MPLHHFRKELIRNQILSTALGGAVVPFTQLDGETGVIAVDSEKEAVLLKELQVFVANGNQYGVVPISAEEFDSLKKNKPYKPSATRSDLLAVAPSQANQPKPQSPGAAPAAADPSQPIKPPARSLTVSISQRKKFTPRVGKAEPKNADAAPAPATEPTEPITQSALP